ncbi:reverse transcriptase family protein [Arcticibacterium luteifluviistationis]|uniref:RNA-directed DNA polymerase n=1 Tax=Arcticibacterium luteifluviistationis TaxID=1784714 RepID=A0A2Z4G943_9BACT|nr:reverse transcriptase family protein [Arcticibacterium luteifluviistationis]AWV97676.1 hypothetical protein DJ013_05655 [Arcticibacterium luteifluviistationis]
MKKLYLADIEERSRRFLGCRTIDDLCCLGFVKNELLLHSLNISYYSFELRKKSGKMRQIESPNESLKKVLRQFNYYLQCVYYIHQTDASQGYIITPKKSKVCKSILENARVHLRNRFMLNIDFQDFFHQISFERLAKRLSETPFKFDTSTSKLLALLFTYKGRLPMGAPTSPVLSNLCVMKLDMEMSEWSKKNGVTYSRFVDDLTFSRDDSEFISDTYTEINHICLKHSLKVNPAKIKYFGEGSLRKVTGLILRETIDIEDGFYHELDKDFNRMKNLVEVVIINHGVKSNDEVQTFKKEIEGQINFIGMVEGYNSPIFNQYRQKLKAVMNPAEEVLSVRWTNFNYV